MQSNNKSNAIQKIGLGIHKKIKAQSVYYFCTVILLEIQLNKLRTETCSKLAEQFVGGAILSYPFTGDEENKSFMKNDRNYSFLYNGGASPNLPILIRKCQYDYYLLFVPYFTAFNY